jgi:hypothetical protein
METPERCAPSAAWTVDSLVKTAAIAPPAGNDCISRPRAATSFKASSRPNTPASSAATYSPMLCPMTADGTTPHERHSSASAYSIAKSAGCV